MNDINEFDKIIKDKMGGFNEMPPSHLWANISAGIVPKVAIIPFYKLAAFKISLLVASVAVILGIGLYTNQNSTNNTITSNIENTNTPAKIINTEIITSNNKDTKENIDKEEIIKNAIIEPKEEVKLAVLKNTDISKNSISQKQNKANIIPTVVSNNNSTKNKISNKTNLGKELSTKNTEKSIALVESTTTEVLASNKKSLKKDLDKEIIVETKEEITLALVQNEDLNNNNNSQKQNKEAKVVPAVVSTNNSTENKIITSNNKDKGNLNKEVIIDTTIIESKEEVKLAILELTDINKDTISQKQNNAKVNPDIVANNISIENEISNNTLLNQELTTKNVEESTIIESNNEVVKEEITTNNNEEVIAATTINEEVVSQENPQEPIQSLLEKSEIVVSETQEEKVSEIPTEALAKENISQTTYEGILNSDFKPEGTVYDKYSIGAHYGYEYINSGNLNASSNNFDLSFSSQNGNFTSQTGIGFQISKDKNSYKQHYVRNEYLATQVRFDSIAFVDNGNGDFTPVAVNPHYTDIYDTIDHTHNDETFETYYSIKIPLFLGYKKSLKYFDIFAQGGIIYSHIFKNKTGKMNELDSESRMLESEYLINERQDNQLQYVAAGGISYSITNRLYFNAELMAKYYHFSLYKNTQSNTNTWSYEARFGITYVLN